MVALTEALIGLYFYYRIVWRFATIKIETKNLKLSPEYSKSTSATPSLLAFFFWNIDLKMIQDYLDIKFIACENHNYFTIIRILTKYKFYSANQASDNELDWPELTPFVMGHYNTS